MLALLFVGGAAQAQGIGKLRDPILGLSYDPARVKFAAADQKLLVECPDLTNARYTRRLWVFARADKGRGEYLVLGGMFVRKDRPQGIPEFKADPQGVVLRRETSSCDLLGPARDVFANPSAYADQGLAIPLLKELAGDAARRYADAFGGAAALRKAMKRQRVRIEGPGAAILGPAFAPLRHG